MNVWLIGGGIYAVALLFGLALCRVSAPTNKRAMRQAPVRPSPAPTAPTTSRSLA
jgi:hypothetical protein